MRLYTELIVDEDCVLGDGNGAISDGSSVGLEAFISAVEAEGCCKTLDTAGWMTGSRAKSFCVGDMPELACLEAL